MVQITDGITRFDILNAENQPRSIGVRYPGVRILTELFTKSRPFNTFSNTTFNNRFSVLECYHSHKERLISLHESLEEANRIGVKQRAIPGATTFYHNKLHLSVLSNPIHNKNTRLMSYHQVPVVYDGNELSETQKWKQKIDLWSQIGCVIFDNPFRCSGELVRSHSVHTPFVLGRHRKGQIFHHVYIDADKEREVTSLVYRVKEGHLRSTRSYMGCAYINLPAYFLFGPTLQKMSRTLFSHYGANKSAIYLLKEKSSPRLQRRTNSKSGRDDILLQSMSQPRETFSGFRICLEDTNRNRHFSCLTTVVPGNHSSDDESQTNGVVKRAMNPKTEKLTDDCNSTEFHSTSIYTNQDNNDEELKIKVTNVELGYEENMVHDQKYPKYEHIQNARCTKVDTLLHALGYSNTSSYQPNSKMRCYECSSQEASSKSFYETKTETNFENVLENREENRNDSNSNYTEERQDRHCGEIKTSDANVFHCRENAKLSSDFRNGDKTSFLQTGVSSTEYKHMDSSSAGEANTMSRCCSFCPGSSWRSLNYTSGFIRTDVGGITFYFTSGDDDVSPGNEAKLSSYKPLAATNSPTKYEYISTSCTNYSTDEDIKRSNNSSTSSRKESLAINSETHLDRVTSFYVSCGDEKRLKRCDINVSVDGQNPTKCVLKSNSAAPYPSNGRINKKDLQTHVENNTSAQQINWSKYSGTEGGRPEYLQTSHGKTSDLETRYENIINVGDTLIESNSLDVCINAKKKHEGSGKTKLFQEPELVQKHNELTIPKSAPVHGSLHDGTIICRDVGTKIETIITKRNDIVRKYVDWSKGDFCCPRSSKLYTCFNYHSDVSSRSKVLIEVQRHDVNNTYQAINAVNQRDPEESIEGLELDEDFHDIGIPELSVRSVCFLPDEYGSDRVLGKGTYGTVYVAEMIVSGRLVVVKEFESEFQVEAEVLKEARILLHLEDTGFVPKLFGLIRGQTLSLVQEFVANGITLHSLIKGNYTCLSCRRWLSICQQMALGLKAIHSKHILHNDIKTDNIIVDFLKNGTPIKYIDFGLSTYQKGFKFCAPNGYLKQYEYLAPEVCRSQHTTVKSEIYSLGYCYKKIAEKALPSLLFLANDCMNCCPEKRPTLDFIISKMRGLLLKTENVKIRTKTQQDNHYK